jgi:hypothetical protein
MTLLETIQIPLTTDQVERVRVIDNEDYSGVCRLVCKEDPFVTEGELAEGILALKQYYAVALLDPCNYHAVSSAVDPYWHAHILHTKEYSRFCEKVYGQYMHHDPLDHADTAKVQRVAGYYGFVARTIIDNSIPLSPQGYVSA